MRQKWFRIICQLIKYSIPFLLVLLLMINVALIIHLMIISFDHPFDRYLFIIFLICLLLTFIRLAWKWTCVYSLKIRGFIWLWVARLRFGAKLVWLIRSLIHVFLRTLLWLFIWWFWCICLIVLFIIKSRKDGLTW